jgi:hypothetical protein
MEPAGKEGINHQLKKFEASDLAGTAMNVAYSV